MKIEKSIIAKVGLELVKEYKGINDNTTYQEWFDNLQWDTSIVNLVEQHLQKGSIKDYLGIDGYIDMMDTINTYCGELLDPTDFYLTFSQWFSIKIEGLLHQHYDFNLDDPIDENKMKIFANMG